jgi:hypothetical protein
MSTEPVRIIVHSEEEARGERCSICTGAISHPTTLDCGVHTYCFKCIAIAMQRERNCPLCRCPVTFLKDQDKFYTLAVLDPDDILVTDEDSDLDAMLERAGNNLMLLPRPPPNQHVPDVRTIFNRTQSYYNRCAAFSWFAIVATFWTTVLIYLHEIIDAYLWKSLSGKILAIAFIVIGFIWTQSELRCVLLPRTRNFLRDTPLTVVVTVLQAADLFFYIWPSTCYNDCWFLYPLRFLWVAAVISVMLIDNPRA